MEQSQLDAIQAQTLLDALAARAAVVCGAANHGTRLELQRETRPAADGRPAEATVTLVIHLWVDGPAHPNAADGPAAHGMEIQASAKTLAEAVAEIDGVLVAELKRLERVRDAAARVLLGPR